MTIASILTLCALINLSLTYLLISTSDLVEFLWAEFLIKDKIIFTILTFMAMPAIIIYFIFVKIDQLKNK